MAVPEIKTSSVSLNPVGALANSPPSPSFNEFIQKLGDKDIFVRQQAVWALSKEEGKKVTPTLIEAYKSIAWMDCEIVTKRWWDKPSCSIKDFQKIKLDVLQGRRRQNILLTLKQRGQDPIPILISQLRDKQWEVRARAAEILGHIGTPGAIPAIPELIKIVMKESFFYVGDMASKALARIGSPAVPALIEKLGTEESMAIMRCLTNIGFPVVQPLRKVLLEKNFYRVEEALSILGWLGPIARAAHPELIQVLKDTYHNIDRIDEALAILKSAGHTLSRIGGASAHEAVSILIPMLKSDDQIVRGSVVSMLGEFGRYATPAIPDLRKMATSDPEYWCRRWAKNALEELQGGIR